MNFTQEQIDKKIKEMNSERVKKWYQEHPEKKAEHRRRWEEKKAIQALEEENK